MAVPNAALRDNVRLWGRESVGFHWLVPSHVVGYFVESINITANGGTRHGRHLSAVFTNLQYCCMLGFAPVRPVQCCPLGFSISS